MNSGQRADLAKLGLYLLATASAHDFGWIGLVDAVERLEATMATMTASPTPST